MKPSGPTKSGNVEAIVWQDVLAIVDDGRARPRDYDVLKQLVDERRALHSSGLGLVVIIPSHARPPADDARAALKHHLAMVPVRCLSWCVEGGGFQAASTRAVLTGLRLFSRGYPTHVDSELEGALRWVLPRLDGGEKRLKDLPTVAAYLRSKRQIVNV